jgi:hypothetical protein
MLRLDPSFSKRSRAKHLALLCLPPIAGCVMLLEIAHDNAHKGPLLAGYYIAFIFQTVASQAPPIVATS